MTAVRHRLQHSALLVDGERPAQWSRRSRRSGAFVLAVEVEIEAKRRARQGDELRRGRCDVEATISAAGMDSDSDLYFVVAAELTPKLFVSRQPLEEKAGQLIHAYRCLVLDGEKPCAMWIWFTVAAA